MAGSGAPDLTRTGGSFLTNEGGLNVASVAGPLHSLFGMAGGFDDCRLDRGLEDWNWQPTIARWTEVLDLTDDQLAEQFRQVRLARPHRCTVCGFRWATEDERDRCCRPGGMKWTQANSYLGCLSRQERGQARELFRRGCYPKQVAQILGWNDRQAINTQTVFGRWRRWAMHKNGMTTHEEFRAYMKSLKNGVQHE